MPRMARVVVPGEPHHVTQRGNNRQDVFFTDDDRRFYLETLKDRAKNIANYLREHTAASVDVREMGRALHALKAEPANQGYDSEILAAATCVGLKRADADASGKREMVA